MKNNVVAERQEYVKINRLGGVKNNPKAIPKTIEIAKPGEWVQLKLFDFE